MKIAECRKARFGKTGMAYQREVDRALTTINLTSLQFITLALVAWFGRTNEPVMQIELARSAGIHLIQIS